MITKVYGSVDGVEVIFTPSTNNAWTCTIPQDADGEYIVELWAESESGNVTYYATILFTVKGVEVSVTWLKLSAQARMREFTVTAKMLSNKRETT
jgi:predicted carbohydrate-binding protein with CBM5 and CBM33 domain